MGLKPGEVAAAGMMLGIVLLVLGITGWIGHLARAIPQSVSAGLQLGLGLLMGVLAATTGPLSAAERASIKGQPGGSPVSQRRTASESTPSIARRSAILARTSRR